jgi:hypothetical protein
VREDGFREGQAIRGGSLARRPVVLLHFRLRCELCPNTPDALVSSVALVEGCDAIVGIDRLCAQRLSQPRCLMLDELAGGC